MKTRVISIFILVAFATLGASSANAAGNVNVKLRVADPHYFSPTAVCTVSVLENSDGMAVLEAAKASGCITSYEIVYYSFGPFLDCINGKCTESSAPYRFWAMRENANIGGLRTPLCPSTNYGIGDFRATNNDELSFTFETLVTSTVPGVCPA